MDPYVVTLTKKAPARTAGQTQDPKSRQAASDIPEGAQTAVALGLPFAKSSPNFPPRKYATIRPVAITRVDVLNSKPERSLPTAKFWLGAMGFKRGRYGILWRKKL